jgi:hypothetical protein
MIGNIFRRNARPVSLLDDFSGRTVRELWPTNQEFSLVDIIHIKAMMMMEAARTSETSLDIQLRIRQYIPEDSELHTRRRENLKSHIQVFSCARPKGYKCLEQGISPPLQGLFPPQDNRPKTQKTREYTHACSRDSNPRSLCNRN